MRVNLDPGGETAVSRKRILFPGVAVCRSPGREGKKHIHKEMPVERIMRYIDS
jgi:hypothetical protein